MNIIKRINWWLVIACVLILVGLYAIWYAIYLFVRLIRDAMFG